MDVADLEGVEVVIVEAEAEAAFHREVVSKIYQHIILELDR